MSVENVTQSQQFKRWFGDWQNRPEQASKVVNDDGTPRVVYHGTDADFTVFQSKAGTYFFSESRDYAESMAEERGGTRIVEAYLNIRDPFYVEMQPGEFSDDRKEAKYIRQAKNEGRDGVVFSLNTGNDIVDDVFYVVFSPEQIKSATDNVGTFDPANPDIRYSLTQATEGRKMSSRTRRDVNQTMNAVQTELRGLIEAETRAARDTQKQVLAELAQTVLDGKNISQEQINDAFETVWNAGRVVDRSAGEAAWDVKEYLRTQGAALSEADQALTARRRRCSI